ncbi:MAG: tRNA (adenosine(37)-N6)-threonylcarbamoyltransferase complex ATPase subunit type 1 TsaE [Candidatus Paceibacterota bacterium]
MEYLTNDFSGTQALGENLAEKAKPGRIARIFCLRGDLGAGKTTFLQGFGRGLKIKERIQSPTFIIMSRTPLKGQAFKDFFHFDCYRLDSPQEIIKLGFEEIISNPENIIAIEWPEKIEKFLPPKTTEIIFKILEENQRKITITEK